MTTVSIFVILAWRLEVRTSRRFNRLFETLGEKIAARRWWVIGAWAVLLLVALPFSFSLTKVVNSTGTTAPGSQSAAVQTVVDRSFPSATRVTAMVVFHRPFRPLDARDRLAIRQATLDLKGDHNVQKVSRPGFAKNGRLAYIVLTLKTHKAVDSTGMVPGLKKRLALVRLPPGLSADLTGTAPIFAAFNNTVAVSLSRAEILTLPLTILVLVFVFGSIAASLIPGLTAFAGITLGLAALYLLRSFVPLTNSVQNAAAMLGLGVGIDYSLILISRFRRESAAGRTVSQALAVTCATAGKTVAFSGCIVAATNLILSAIGQPLLVSLSLGVFASVTCTVLASLTLTPALLACLGPHLEWPRGLGRWKTRVVGVAFGHRGFWASHARRIMARPWAVLIATGTVVLLLAIPALNLRLQDISTLSLPPGLPAREGYLRYTQAFGAGSLGPITLLVHSPDGVLSPGFYPKLRRLEKNLRQEAGVARVVGVADLPGPRVAALRLLPRRPKSVENLLSADRRSTLIYVYPKTDPNSQASFELVHRLRRLVAGDKHVLVGGSAAKIVDIINGIGSSFPALALAVMALTYLILLVLLRSILLPLKAVLLTLLSTLASYGFLFLFFQAGYGSALLGFHPQTAIAWSSPPLVFSILFGLSTDYEVFLLSRIQEHYQATGDNRESVARGLEETAGIITSAAFLMVTVFVSFGFSPLVLMQEIGLGMSFAIILDATLVRMRLVPATMALLGPWNWWLPPWLSRFLPPPETVKLEE